MGTNFCGQGNVVGPKSRIPLSDRASIPDCLSPCPGSSSLPCPILYSKGGAVAKGNSACRCWHSCRSLCWGSFLLRITSSRCPNDWSCADDAFIGEHRLALANGIQHLEDTGSPLPAVMTDRCEVYSSGVLSPPSLLSCARMSASLKAAFAPGSEVRIQIQMGGSPV